MPYLVRTTIDRDVKFLGFRLMRIQLNCSVIN